jgi:phage antirepressor YoqD-like protein
MMKITKTTLKNSMTFAMMELQFMQIKKLKIKHCNFNIECATKVTKNNITNVIAMFDMVVIPSSSKIS